jgi:hypothetical protein
MCDNTIWELLWVKSTTRGFEAEAFGLRAKALTVTDIELDDLVSIPGGSSLSFQAGSGARPAPYPEGSAFLLSGAIPPLPHTLHGVVLSEIFYVCLSRWLPSHGSCLWMQDGAVNLLYR